jgi:hypothetical protein
MATVKRIGKVRKLSRGTYRVTFGTEQVYDVIVPVFWLEAGVSEAELREIAREVATEQLPRDATTS